MTRCCTILLGALLLASPLAAQEPAPADDAKANTEALLAGLSGVDEALLGKTHYGIYVGGSKNLGTFVLTVERAPEGSGAVYKVGIDMKMSMMGGQSGWILLDEKLALVESLRKEEKKGQLTTTTVKKVGDEWVQEKTVGEGEPTVRKLPIKGLDHSGMASGILLCRKLDPSKKSYAFAGVKWGKADPSYVTTEVSVTGAETIDHRGEKLETTRIVAKTVGETTQFWLDGGRNVLQLGPVGPPILMVAGTAEEATQPLAAPEAAKPLAGGGAATPKAAVVTYFNVLAKSQKVDELDKVMDWQAIRDEMVKEKPETGIFDAAGIAKMMKEKFDSGPAPVTQEQVDMLAAMLTEAIEGDTAKVTMPGKEDDAFELRKAEHGWVLTHFPH